MSAESPKVRFILYYREGSANCEEVLDLFDAIENPHTRQTIRLQDVDKLKRNLKHKGKTLPAYITGVPLLTTNIKDKKRRIWIGPSANEMMRQIVERANDNMSQSYENLPQGEAGDWAQHNHSGHANRSILKGHAIARTTANELGGTAASIVDEDLYHSEMIGSRDHGSNGNTSHINDRDIANFMALRDRTAPKRLRDNMANWGNM